jgi:hypothetical protein
MRSERNLEIEEELEDLDHKLTRLKIEYDLYFSGNGKREPSQLRAEIQRAVTKYTSEPPRNAGLKFKFNSICARFQAYRAMWGRTVREIEAGTYRGHRFRADLHDRERGRPVSDAVKSAPKAEKPRGADAQIDRLYEALVAARAKTGDTTPIDRETLARNVRRQAAEIKKKHGDAKLRFKVVIEGNKAKLKATVG